MVYFMNTKLLKCNTRVLKCKHAAFFFFFTLIHTDCQLCVNEVISLFLYIITQWYVLLF